MSNSLLPRLRVGIFLGLVSLACAAPTAPTGSVGVRVTALTAGTHAEHVTVYVRSAAGMLDNRVDLRVCDGLAEGVITVEPGPGRVISARAYDELGLVTHVGTIGLVVLHGEEPYAMVPMTARPGESPIALWLGSHLRDSARAAALGHGD